MKWKDVINQLFAEHEYNAVKFERETGVSSAAIYKILNGKTGKPNSFTISQIEKVFSVRIDDSNPDELKIIKSSPEPGIMSKLAKAVEEFNNSNILKEYNIPLVGMAPAGVNDIIPLIDAQLASITVDASRQFAVIVEKNIGTSMAPLLKPGDIVFCSTTQKVADGDLALCRWKNEAAIKMVSLNPEGLPDMVILHSYNPTGPTVIVPKKDIRVYPIIFIRKFLAQNGDK